MVARLQPCHPFRSADARDRYLAYYDARDAAWPIPFEGRTVPTDQGETFVRISGPEGAPSLVLQPGVWGGSLMWEPVIAALSGEYRTYAVDNICDFGRSVSRARITSVAGFMAWLDDLLDALGLLEGVSMLGMSRGGWLTAEYTLHAPHRLAAAVWHSPAGVVLMDYLVALRALPPTISVMLAPSESNVRRMMLGVTPHLAREDPEAFDEFVNETLLGLQCFDPRVTGSAMGPRLFSDHELGSVRVPVLYIAGEDEMLYSPHRAAERLSAVAPRIESVIVPAAGHDLGVGVQQRSYTDAVLHFLGDAHRRLTEQAPQPDAP